jgi:GAF domain-containing protein
MAKAQLKCESTPESKATAELIQMLEARENGRELLKQILALLETRLTLKDFLAGLLVKLHNIFGSDLACIGLVKEVNGRPRLVVQDRERHVIVGAVLGEITDELFDVVIGGDELPDSEKSLTGYVAYTKEAKCIGNLPESEEKRRGFYWQSLKGTISELAVPILYADREVLGVINLESKSPDKYSEADKSLVQWVARLIARHLDSMMNREGIRKPYLTMLDRINEKLENLHINAEPSAALYLSSDANEILDAVSAEIARALSSERCEIWILTKDRSRLVLAGQHGAEKSDTLVVRLRNDPMARRAIDQRHLLSFGPPDVSEDQSWLVSPLMARRCSYGVIKVTGRKKIDDHATTYSLGDERMLSVIDRLVAAQLDLKRQEWERREDAMKRRQHVAALLEVFADLNYETVFSRAIGKIVDVCKADHCSIFLLDRTTGNFLMEATSPLPPALRSKKQYKPGQGLTGWVAEQGRPLVLRGRRDSDLAHVTPPVSWEDKEKEVPPELLDRPYMAIPIRLDDKTVGVIRCTDKLGEQAVFTEADVDLVSLIASHVAATVAFKNRYDIAVTFMDNTRRMLASVNGARKPLSVRGLEGLVFKEILGSAREIFQADLAIIHKISGGQHDGVIHSGEMHYQEYVSSEPDSIVYKLLCGEEGFLFSHDCFNDPRLTTASPVPGSHKPRGRFVVREQIRSSMGVRLKGGNAARGVLFLNYRRPFEFTSRVRDALNTFSNLADLYFEIIGLYKSSSEIAENLDRKIIPELVVEVEGGAKSGRQQLTSGDPSRAAHTFALIENSSKVVTHNLSGIVGRLTENLGRIAYCL